MVLSTLDSDSAIGPDGISSCALKTCSAALTPLLSAFFTLSFVLGHLPSAWKSANMAALLKKNCTLVRRKQFSLAFEL